MPVCPGHFLAHKTSYLYMFGVTVVYEPLGQWLSKVTYRLQMGKWETGLKIQICKDNVYSVCQNPDKK